MKSQGWFFHGMTSREWVVRLSELDTPAFREFLQQAAASFFGNLQRMQQKPEDVMPWKVDGERWHLGEKGFPPGKKVKWDRALLTQLLKIVQAVEPSLEVDWAARDLVKLRVPGIGRAWGYWRTKDHEHLDVRFFGKKGQLNLDQLEGIGRAPEIDDHRPEGDYLRFCFLHAEHLQATRPREVLRSHLEGFRAAFGKEKGVVES